MTGILVTGGTGFVLSNLVRRLLERWPEAGIVVLDLAAEDALAAAFLGPPGRRLRLVAGDVRDPAALRAAAEGIEITHVVHGATVTHDAAAERRDPTRYLDVNLGGTVQLLEWLRGRGGAMRLLHVSTGGVYGNPQPGTPEAPQPEDGPFDPPELYAVSKYAAELVVRRYAGLFGIPACRVRFADVFGPMERPTGARRGMSLPFHMMRALIEDRPLRISARSMQAGGDYLSAEDVADALLLLLRADRPPFDLFNIAAGRWRPLPELLGAFAAVAPSFRHAVVPQDEAEIDFDPANRLARYNAYAIDRIGALGWRPRPLEQQLAGYLAWVMADPAARCPAPAARRDQ